MFLVADELFPNSQVVDNMVYCGEIAVTIDPNSAY